MMTLPIIGGHKWTNKSQMNVLTNTTDGAENFESNEAYALNK